MNLDQRFPLELSRDALFVVLHLPNALMFRVVKRETTEKGKLLASE